MGTIVKRHLAERLGRDPGAVYHVAIMPCYDKKLEASRPDFDVPGTARPPASSEAACVCCHAFVSEAQHHAWAAMPAGVGGCACAHGLKG